MQYYFTTKVYTLTNNIHQQVPSMSIVDFLLKCFIDQARKERCGGGIRRPKRTPNFSKGTKTDEVMIININIQIIMKDKMMVSF